MAYEKHYAYEFGLEKLYLGSRNNICTYLRSTHVLNHVLGGVDVIIVPGRAFTKSGHRLGRGKGYYDTYLYNYSRTTNGRMPYLIGLAYSQQIFDELPVSSHDIMMNEVIYDNRGS